MNRTDAATILSIDPSASADEARRAYQELFTEHQVRLTNAPTPALRSLYQARLLELDEARDAFLSNSVSDADSDLPTDQPSIPTYRAGEPPHQGTSAPPPPPRSERVEAELPPPPPRKEPPPVKREPAVISDGAADQKKSALARALPIGIGLLLVVGALTQIPRLLSKDTNGTASTDDTDSPAKSAFADSIPKLRESLTVARVEFGRGDYDAANSALKDADAFLAGAGSAAAADTAVAQIKSQVDSLHSKVARACEALKRVAERHPGEPTCKTL